MNNHEQIFKSLCTHMKTGEFLSAQATFMQQHQDTFDANDENKLEYTNIYEAYV